MKHTVSFKHIKHMGQTQTTLFIQITTCYNHIHHYLYKLQHYTATYNAIYTSHNIRHPHSTSFETKQNMVQRHSTSFIQITT